MLKPLFDFARQLIALTQETQQNRSDIKEVRQELKELRGELQRLTLIVQKISFETQRVSENEKHEREKLVLQWKHELSVIERRLPPPKNEE